MPPSPLLFHSPNDWTSNQLEDLRLVRHFNASLDEILGDDYLPKDGDEGWACTLSFIVVLELLTWYGRIRIARHGICRTDRKRVKESLANSNTCPIQAQHFPAGFSTSMRDAQFRCLLRRVQSSCIKLHGYHLAPRAPGQTSVSNWLPSSPPGETKMIKAIFTYPYLEL